MRDLAAGWWTESGSALCEAENTPTHHAMAPRLWDGAALRTEDSA